MKATRVKIDFDSHIITIKPPKDIAWHNLHYAEGFDRFVKGLLNILAKFCKVEVLEMYCGTETMYSIQKGEKR